MIWKCFRDYRKRLNWPDWEWQTRTGYFNSEYLKKHPVTSFIEVTGCLIVFYDRVFRKSIETLLIQLEYHYFEKSSQKLLSSYSTTTLVLLAKWKLVSSADISCFKTISVFSTRSLRNPFSSSCNTRSIETILLITCPNSTNLRWGNCISKSKFTISLIRSAARVAYPFKNW